jgi:hypothetical protein
VSTNFLSAGVNYNITHNSWSGNVSAWQVGKGGWTFNPSVSAMVYPEHTTNLFRGQGFRSNNQVLSNFVDANNYQGALNYWGFKGTFDPNNELFNGGNDPGVTHPVTGEIFYNETAFTLGFDKLHFIADHEYWHHRRVVSGKYSKSGNSMVKEEYLNWTRNYRNQGLYRDHGYDDIGMRINSYGTKAGINPDVFFRYSFNKPWWHFIYNTRRKW